MTGSMFVKDESEEEEKSHFSETVKEKWSFHPSLQEH
jgi:hypothetical protein